MMKIQGKNGVAKVYTDILENLAAEQIKSMLDNAITEKTQVRIMSDVHAGKGSTIGTTIRLPENFADWKVSPNIVGSDVGCGIMMYALGNEEVDLEKLDKVINELIPSGFIIHDEPQNKEFTENALANLTLNIQGEKRERVHNSLGTLGGGNHFIELGYDSVGKTYWLSVHSGSRNLGSQVASQHQKIAIKRLHEKKADIKGLIQKLKDEGRHSEISLAIVEAKKAQPSLSNEAELLAHLEGEDLKNYLNDMIIAQKYAELSRKTMLDIIVEAMDFSVVDKFDSVHNFVEHDNFKNGIIRKGATSAKEGERLVIPLNMRDGSLIAIGKGNKDWNLSAPHGAGRMMSRTKARQELTLDKFKEQMKEVYSSSIGESTIDEAPDAYKPAESIIKNIEPTADIMFIAKPVYNFKAH